ncbi:chloramphenicol resistance protein [Colletotrichum asianum]
MFILIPFILSFLKTYRTIVNNRRSPAASINKPLIATRVPKIDSRVISEGPLPEGRRWLRIINPFNCLKIIFTKNASNYLALYIGKVIDHDYKVITRQYSIIINASSISLRWSIGRQAHLSALIILVFLCGITTTAVFTEVIQMSSNEILQISLILIVDIHPTQAGLASISVNLTRYTAAAVDVIALQPLLDSLGIK